MSEIWKERPTDATVHFWRSRSGAEVDFVIARRDALLAIEVKAAALARPKLSRAARSFIDAYRPAQLLVVNTGLEHELSIGATRVRWLSPAAVGAAARAVGDRRR